MANRFLIYGLKWLGIILIQLLILNDLHLHGYVRPFVYPLIIMMLPAGISTSTSMIVAFVIGIIVDIDLNSPGMHASALVLIAFIRPAILSLISNQGGYQKDESIGMSEMGITWFLKFLFLVVLVHHIYFFLLYQFNLNNLFNTLLSILLSSLVSMIMIFILEVLFNSRSLSKIK